MYRIFLVEDDYALADAMKKQLEAFGYEVRVANDFFHIVEEFQKTPFQLVLMDVMLPHSDGFQLCREIRKLSAVPILFVSSASDNMNVVKAINMGGDDFIAKPVDPLVLNAKVGAILRRAYEITDASVMEFHGAFLNLSDGTVSFRDARIDLTKNEFRILQTLLENKGKTVSREDLMIKLWQSDLYVEENTLTVNVGRLRKKLEENGLDGVIVTKPGIGYLIP